jgi:hypothetical protein
MLANQSTRSAFGNPEPVDERANCSPTAVRG